MRHTRASFSVQRPGIEDVPLIYSIRDVVALISSAYIYTRVRVQIKRCTSRTDLNLLIRFNVLIDVEIFLPEFLFLVDSAFLSNCLHVGSKRTTNYTSRPRHS